MSSNPQASGFSHTVGHVVQTVTTVPARGPPQVSTRVSVAETPGQPSIPARINRTAPLPKPSPLASSSTIDQSRESMSSRRPNPKSVQESSQRATNSRTVQEPRLAATTNERSEMSSMRSIMESDYETADDRSGNATSTSSPPQSGNIGNNITDFFSSEVFHIVLHNPTTAHRLLRFCQSRACGENMEFLQKVDQYNRLLDEASQLLGTIHSTYTSADAPRQINISNSILKRVTSEVRQASQSTIPTLENIFLDPQEHIENILAADIYPRFVKHQVTASATMALANHRDRFQGLGDCFCMTDPNIADNPILYASDGFVSVTGYNRKEIVPRNCRFLQGDLTDVSAPRRLRTAIDSCEEIVELLLNYRKNGDPFWNLLYVSPLLNEKGEVPFFLGGQINCSTTIHSRNDVLRILSLNDDELDRQESVSRNRPPSINSRDTPQNSGRLKSSFYKSWRKYNPSSKPAPAKRVVVQDQAGMEPVLVERLGKMNFKTQVEAFYTAYSKYIVMEYNAPLQTITIRFYSPGIIDILCLNLPNGAIAPIFNKDIFKVLSEHSSASGSSSTWKAYKQTVKDALSKGRAVSVETGLMTGFAERKSSGGWLGSGNREGSLKRVEERYITHWTPLKDEEGRVRWVVMTIAPKD